MRSVLRKIMPEFLIRIYRSFKKKSRAGERARLKAEGRIVTQESLEENIKEWGIREGDTVMLHSSLSKIGFVEGGAETVIGAFLNVLGKSGTLAMPASSSMGFNYDHLKTSPVFDVRNTPSKMGAVSETFRKMPGVRRSVHPTDSVAALGPLAESLTGEHYGQLTPYNQYSPFYKLGASGAKIVLLGVDLNSLTNLHTLEDAVENFRFPVYHPDIFKCEVVDEKGVKSSFETRVHDPKWSKRRQCNELIPLFREGGFLLERELGLAKVYIIRAGAMFQWMVKNYNEKGITMYTPGGSVV